MALYALQESTGPDAEAPWPTAFQNNRNTNRAGDQQNMAPNQDPSLKLRSKPPEIIWELADSGEPVAVDDLGNVFVRSQGLCKIDPEGKLIWRSKSKAKILGPLFIDNEFSYYRSDTGYIQIDNKNGLNTWEIEINTNTRCAPSILNNGHLVLPSFHRTIYVYDPKSKQRIIQKNLDTAFKPNSNIPINLNNHGFVVSEDSIQCIDFNNGNTIWKNKENDFLGPIAIDEKCIYLGTSDKKLLCINQNDGSIKWEIKRSYGIQSKQPLVLNNSVIFVGLDAFRICSMNKETGELNWWKQKQWISHSFTATEDDQIICRKGNEGICSIDTNTGEILWRYKTEGEKGADFTDQIYINADGILYTSKRFDKQLLALQLPAGPPKDAPWPMFQQNPKNTSRIPNKSEPRNRHTPAKLKWTYKTDGLVKSHPIVDYEGSAYISVDGNQLLKISPNGQLDWKAFDPNLCTLKPILNTSGDIFASRGAALSKIKSNNGKFSRKSNNHFIDVDQTIYTYASLYNDKSIILPCANGFKCFDQNEGLIKWTYKWSEPQGLPGNPRHLQIPVAVNQHGIAFVSFGSISAFDTKDGKKLWETMDNGSIKAIDEEFIYYSRKTRLYCIRQNDGEQIWTRDLYSPIHGQVIITRDGLYALCSNSKVYRLNKGNGQFVWRSMLSGPQEKTGTPAVTEDGQIYVVNGENELVSLSTKDGSKNWSVAVSGNVNQTVTIGDDGTIYLVGSDNVHAFQGHLVRPRMHLGQCSNRTAETVAMHMMKNPKAVQIHQT